MARCGCRGSSSVNIVSGRGSRVRGSGGLNDPIVIDAFPMSLVVQDSESVNMSMVGTGTAVDPWVISATVNAGLMNSRWGRWYGTQAEYDAEGPYNPNTLYVVSA